MPKVSSDLVKNLQFFVKDMPGCLYFKDKDGHYLACSDYLIKTSNFGSHHDIIGKTDFDLFAPEQAKKLRMNDLQVMKTGKAVTAEEIITLPIGEKRYFEVIKVPFRDPQHKIIGIIGNSVDITERKNAEERSLLLEKEKVAIETKRQVISELAASIAHEIGNILSGVIINTQLLGYKLKATVNDPIEKTATNYQEVLALFDRLKKNLQNANFMFESIKMNIRSGEISKSQFEHAEINADIETILTNCFPEENIVAQIKWDKKNNFQYIGIPAYTRNVLINLMKNALHFIKENKRGVIKVSLKKGNQFNQLIFKDTAQGIAPDELPKIFQPFSTARKNGNGMGLAFCKRIMHAYGGDITCESVFGKYTKFILSFPALKH